MLDLRVRSWCLASLCVFAACSGDDGDASESASQSSDQTPPRGAAAVEAWLSKGAYKTWSCESDVHESRSPSPHGFNRICSNDRISANADGDKPWPRGAAAVKELYAARDDREPVGYAVYEKTAADSGGGDAWYWYERVPLDSAAPHAEDGVVADGLGSSGAAKSICVACHAAAGSDDAHTPTPGGRDQVYTPVP